MVVPHSTRFRSAERWRRFGFPSLTLPSARTARAVALPAAAAVLLLAGIADTATAQDVEVSVLSGALAYTPVSDTDLAAEAGGRSLTAGVRIGHRWFWGGDITAVGFRVADGEPFYTSRTSALVALAEVGRRAAITRRIDLVLSGGTGLARTRSRLLSQTFVARDPLVHAGTGLDLRITRRLFLGADVRYVRTFGFPTDASRTEIDSTRLPWPSTHQVRAGLGARIRW